MLLIIVVKFGFVKLFTVNTLPAHQISYEMFVQNHLTSLT